jgi:hypothetical protein
MPCVSTRDRDLTSKGSAPLNPGQSPLAWLRAALEVASLRPSITQRERLGPRPEKLLVVHEQIQT